MRMIAEILECPFQLNILDERTITESGAQAGQGAGIETGTAGRPGGDGLEGSEALAAEKSVSDQGGEKSKESNVRTHERDVTIGELVDIQEELDALMQKAAGEARAGKEHEENGKAPSDERNIQNARKERDGQDDPSHDPGGHLQENETGYAGEHPQENEAGLLEGHVEGHVEEHEQESNEDRTGYRDENAREDRTDRPGGQLYANMQERPEGYEGRTQASLQAGHGEQEFAGYSGEDEEGNMEKYPGEPENGHVEELLQEIESLEKTEKKESVQEEKPHGWRAYLKQRFKKLGREQSRTEKETAEADSGDDKTYSGSNYPDSGYEGNHFSEEFSVESYGEDSPEGEYSARAYVGEYSGNEYSGNEYSGNGYLENEYSGNGHSGNEYSGNEYSGESYEGEYLYAGHMEETAQEEILSEDDEDKGDVNPYTGKEYETNSVRMHPSRIGYVQVYDRTNHQWTDMTEWAFLGYQERKKQLLGKDYDPPIYLD